MAGEHEAARTLGLHGGRQARGELGLALERRQLDVDVARRLRRQQRLEQLDAVLLVAAVATTFARVTAGDDARRGAVGDQPGDGLGGAREPVHAPFDEARAGLDGRRGPHQGNRHVVRSVHGDGHREEGHAAHLMPGGNGTMRP